MLVCDYELAHRSACWDLVLESENMCSEIILKVRSMCFNKTLFSSELSV